MSAQLTRNGTEARPSMRNLILASTALAGLALASAAARAQAPAQPLGSPVGLVDSLQGVFGTHAGARRSHAKGVCATGSFTGSAEGARISTAAFFNGQAVPAVLRFSVGGGNPRAPDTGRSVRGLGASFTLPNNESFGMALISAPMFFAATPAQFQAFMEARRVDPATGQMDSTRVAAFSAANPETTRQGAWLAANPPPASYATAAYNSVNSFIFVDAAGQRRHARWSFVPVGGVQGLTPEQMQTLPANFLVGELRNRAAAGTPIAYDLMVTFAEPGDDVTNPTTAWPADRPAVNAGRLTVTGVSPDEGGACRAIIFNPTALPRGIEPSADPTLPARAPSYAVSLSRRAAQ
jgi:catalase